jgi:hypothetical protein
LLIQVVNKKRAAVYKEEKILVFLFYLLPVLEAF